MAVDRLITSGSVRKDPIVCEYSSIPLSGTDVEHEWLTILQINNS